MATAIELAANGLQNSPGTLHRLSGGQHFLDLKSLTPRTLCFRSRNNVNWNVKQVGFSLLKCGQPSPPDETETLGYQ